MERTTSKERTEYMIVKSNDLIQTAAFGLTNLEYALLNYTIMRIRPEDTSLRPQKINIQEFCKTVGISETDNYQTIKRAAKGLADKYVWAVIETKEGKKEKLVRWIEDPEIRRGMIIIQLKSYWEPFLIDLQERYTQMLLQETLPMKSVYGVRTYELLKSYLMNRKGPVTVRMTVDEYKRILLGNDKYKKKYKEFQNFKKRVLTMAMKDLSEYGELNVTYKPVKEGYSYKYIDFTIEQRTLDEKLDIWKKEENYFRKQ